MPPHWGPRKHRRSARHVRVLLAYIRRNNRVLAPLPSGYSCPEWILDPKSYHISGLIFSLPPHKKAISSSKNSRRLPKGQTDKDGQVHTDYKLPPAVVHVLLQDETPGRDWLKWEYS